MLVCCVARLAKRWAQFALVRSLVAPLLTRILRIIRTEQIFENVMAIRFKSVSWKDVRICD